MSKFPKNWRNISIGEIGNVVTGATPPTGDANNYIGNIPFISPADFKGCRLILETKNKISALGLSTVRQIPEKAVLVTCIGSIGKVGMTVKNSATNQQINAILCNKENNPEYIYYLMLNSESELISISAVTTLPIINKSTFEKFRVYVPALIEQKKIAEILTSIDKVIELTEIEIEKLKNLKTGMMQDLLTKGIGHTKFKDSPIGKIPESWDCSTIKAVAKVKAGSTPLRANMNYFKSGKHFWLKTLDLNNDFLYQTEEKITDLAVKENSCSIMPIGTVFIAMYGGMNQIGRSGLAKVEMASNQAVSGLIIKDKKQLLPEYLLHWANFNRQYLQGCAASSRKDPNITKVDIENMPIIIPNINEQNQIINVLRTIDNKIFLKNKKLQKSNELKKGLMQDLLTGKVRVKV